jgi:adenylate kinase
MSSGKRESSDCKVLVLGPPLAGKGTQSKLLSAQLSIPHISSGDILREKAAGEENVSAHIRERLRMGEFIEDALVRSLINEKIHSISGGFILDGYPRTLDQFESIDFPYDRIIFISTSLDTILDRAKGRLYHPKSGRIYHVRFNPPKTPGLDDETNEPLFPREDDKEEIVRHRFLDFMSKTEKVIERGLECGKVTLIDGNEDVSEVHASVLRAIEAIN